jgi:hypothetical protein
VRWRFTIGGRRRSLVRLARYTYRLIPIAAELVTVFILDAGLDARIRLHFPIMPSFISAFAAARRPVSPVHVIIVATPVLAHRSMIVILVHHSAHLAMHLTHAIHIHALLATLPRSPITVDAGLLSALTISVACLIRLLRCTLWLDWSLLGLDLVGLLRRNVGPSLGRGLSLRRCLLSRGTNGQETGDDKQEGSHI